MTRNLSVDLWSLDGCHFQQYGTRIRMWVPPEDMDPIQFLAPTCKSLGLLGPVSLDTDQLLTEFGRKFDAMTFQGFLEKLLKHEEPRIGA